MAPAISQEIYSGCPGGLINCSRKGDRFIGENLMSTSKTDSMPFFLVGLATGAALSFLLAPRSGASTRRLIERKVDEGKGFLKSKVDELKERVKEPTPKSDSQRSGLPANLST